MEEKHAIEVKDLVISYQNLKKTSIKKTLLHLKRQKPDRFVAVKGISFYVREGEILGIIGKNGSGKSTTLNALAGIFSPDSGSIDLNGHSISLLSIGVGFIREMTGRENITLSGMLLGFFLICGTQLAPEGICLLIHQGLCCCGILPVNQLNDIPVHTLQLRQIKSSFRAHIRTSQNSSRRSC